MRKLILLVFFVVVILFVSLSSVLAGAIHNKDGSRGKVIVWESEDAFDACSAEMRETGKAGPICISGVRAMVQPGTKARRIKGWLFLKIQILDGPDVGTIGYIPMEFYKP